MRGRLGGDKVCPTCKVRIPNKKSKYVGLLFHDLRRSMARNQRRKGTSEKTIKSVGGWKTNSVFERYDIQDERGLDDFARGDEERRAQFRRNQTESAPDQVQGEEGKEGGKQFYFIMLNCEQDGGITRRTPPSTAHQWRRRWASAARAWGM